MNKTSIQKIVQFSFKKYAIRICFLVGKIDILNRFKSNPRIAMDLFDLSLTMLKTIRLHDF